MANDEFFGLQEERPIPQPGKGGMFSIYFSSFFVFCHFFPSEMRPRNVGIGLFSYRMIDRIFKEISSDISQILSRTRN